MDVWCPLKFANKKEAPVGMPLSKSKTELILMRYNACVIAHIDVSFNMTVDFSFIYIFDG